ncbi:MAG: glycosyltransferase family 4 protein [Tepidiformaceae bacterium]
MQHPQPATVAISHLWRYDGLEACARALDSQGRLAAFYVPLDASRYARLARRLPGSARRAERILQRRAGISRSVSTSVLPTLVISAFARLPAPRFTPQRKALYSRWYQNHDRVVASRLEKLRPALYVAAGIPATRSLRAARTLGIPSVFSISEDPWDLVEVARIDVGPGDPAFATAARRNLAQHRAAAVEASCVAVESGHVAAHLRADGVDTRRILTLGQGVDLSHFPFRSRPPGARPLRIITVSRPTPFKGLDYAIEAVRRAGDVVETFRWLGRGALPANMRATADAMASLPNGTYDGEVPFTEIPAAYERADVCVLPSLADSMSRAVLEAMASGLPVIVTPQSGYGDIIRDGIDGFVVPPRDPKAIADRLATLSADPNLRASMGAAARATAEEFTWDRYTQRLMDGLATCAELARTDRLDRK